MERQRVEVETDVEEKNYIGSINSGNNLRQQINKSTNAPFLSSEKRNHWQILTNNF